MKTKALTYGKIGILLPIASIIPYFGKLAGIASVVLLILAYNNFSKFYEKKEIFSKYALGLAIRYGGVLIGILLLIMAVGVAALSIFTGGFTGFSDNYDKLLELTRSSLGILILFFIVIYAAVVIGTYFEYQSKILVSEKTGVSEYKTAGLLYFIGAIALIVFGLGIFVIFIGWIFEIVAFFNTKEDQEVIV